VGVQENSNNQPRGRRSNQPSNQEPSGNPRGRAGNPPGSLGEPRNFPRSLQEASGNRRSLQEASGARAKEASPPGTEEASRKLPGRDANTNYSKEARNPKASLLVENINFQVTSGCGLQSVCTIRFVGFFPNQACLWGSYFSDSNWSV
jgi:hypothetical protein